MKIDENWWKERREDGWEEEEEERKRGEGKGLNRFRAEMILENKL